MRSVLLEAMDAAVAAVAAVRRGAGGRLRVGSFATADAVLVPSVVADLRREAPDLATTVTEGLTRDLVAGLRAGALDVAVVSDYPDGPVDDAGLVLEHLCDDELLVALPPGHRLTEEPTIDLADLADESWIEAGRLAVDNTTVNLLAARAGFVPRTDITVPGWTAKQGFVAAGLGVTLVPRLAAAAMRPDIVLRPVRDPAARRRVHVARPAGRLGEVDPDGHRPLHPGRPRRRRPDHVTRRRPAKGAVVSFAGAGGAVVRRLVRSVLPRRRPGGRRRAWR